jgi:hypothetical protein
MNEPLIYDTDDYRKHKRPGGWGSPCPADLDETPQRLLETGVEVERSVYNVSGKYALCAETHRPGRWHGYPIPWSRLPAQAKNALIAAGRLDGATFLKAIRKGWGKEFQR